MPSWIRRGSIPSRIFRGHGDWLVGLVGPSPSTKLEVLDGFTTARGSASTSKSMEKSSFPRSSSGPFLTIRTPRGFSIHIYIFTEIVLAQSGALKSFGNVTGQLSLRNSSAQLCWSNGSVWVREGSGMPSMKNWERRFSMPMTSRYRDIERSRSKKSSQKCYEFSYKGYSLQEFIVPLSSCAYWLDVRGAYGGGYGLQEGGRPITITCCLHGLERGQRLIVGVGGTGR